MVKVRKQTAVEWAMKGGSIMKTGRNIAVLAVSLLAVLVLLWIGRGDREPEQTEVSDRRGEEALQRTWAEKRTAYDAESAYQKEKYQIEK